jgi:hypothetical protein
VSRNSGLQNLLEDLSKKADEAEDALDELQYFMIQDKLDGTQEAALELGVGLLAHALHARHAARHTIGNWIACCFCCSPTQDDNSVDSGSGKLKLDRVDMSERIKLMMESIDSLGVPISDLLRNTPKTMLTIKRPPTSAMLNKQDKLHGRGEIFEQTVSLLTNGHTETLSVLPFVGPGGIGKTTFTRHLYNDERIKAHFTVKVWVCVSTEFDLIKLTREILGCIQGNNTATETSNLTRLQESIAERLKSKRFLIVLDDIWNYNSKAEWENLLVPFKQGETKGSMVLLTTRFSDIAHSVATADLVKLHGLNHNDFLRLFEACIFGDTKPKNYEDELRGIAIDIAKILKGSPLAANTVGRLLQKNHSPEYWMEVLEKNKWHNAKNEDDIMFSLKISYDYLSYPLKKCFAYFSLFPEDYEFYSSEITHLWIAIGIIDSSCQSDNNTFLKELVDRGFLMEGTSGECYVMHDLMHELSRNVSSKDCANISSLSFADDSYPRSIRHVSITIDNKYDECFREGMGKLKDMIDIENLRTLMIFGYPDARIVNILKDTFESIKRLRVLSIKLGTKESLPKNFSNLIHLRYLKISSRYAVEMTLPSTLSRFYHLKFLDLENWEGNEQFPKDFSHLVNLCHINCSNELHSSIPKVGKMKCLQELKKFHVKKESLGFELTELGELRDLGGELCICNLEKVACKEEAGGADMKNKKKLNQLTLVWGTEHLTVDDDVLDGFEPHRNLRALCIINPGVAAGPSWLCGDMSTSKLESLHLEGVSWDIHPPFEKLPYLNNLILRNVGMDLFGPGFGVFEERSFMHLKTIVFEDMPELERWVGLPYSNLFPRLESITCKNCPLLCSIPFMDWSDRFTELSTLDIDNCPKLPQFPPMPHTSTLTSMSLKNNESNLSYERNSLYIDEYEGPLVFQNMDTVVSIHIQNISGNSLSELNGSLVLRSVQSLSLEKVHIEGKLFSKALKCFPALSYLDIQGCTYLKLEDGGLADLTMLQSFTTIGCYQLFSRWKMGQAGGAQTIKPFLPSLRKLEINGDAGIKSMALLSNLTFLTKLHLTDCEELTMDGFNPLMIVNLKDLVVFNAKFGHSGESMSIAGDLLSEMARSKFMHGSFQPESVDVDSITALLVAPTCSHLAGTLHKLYFTFDNLVESFTEEQEKALQLLTSLKELRFCWCPALQSLPHGLDRISSLMKLEIQSCKKIQSLPTKEGLPTSLHMLRVWYCSPELTEEANRLKEKDSYFSALLDGT